MFNWSRTRGFTIVELLIVVTVIAILAAIVLVAYNGVQGRAVESMLKSSIVSAAQKLEAHNVENGAYPSLVRDIGIANTDAVHFQYDGPGPENSYCLSVTSPNSKSVAYHTKNGSTTPLTGVCDGHVGPGEGDVEESFSFERTVTSAGPMALKVHAGEVWDKVDISWTPQAGAKKYEVQSRNPASATGTVNTFYYRNQHGGSFNSGNASSAYSGMIPSSTTSLTWADTTSGVPRSTGQVFEYRARYQKSDDSYSDWESLEFKNPIQGAADLRRPANFTVTPNADYTDVTLSWNQVPSFSPNMSEVKIEVQSRNPASSVGTVNTFYYRNQYGGSFNSSNGSSTWSGMIPSSTTSLTWTDTTSGVPRSTGQVFEYRMRLRSQGERAFETEWSDVVTVAYPIRSDTGVPNIAGFTVTPDADYTNVTLSWDQVPSFSPNMSEVKIEVQSRNPASATGTVNTFYYRNQYGGSYNSINSISNWSGMIPSSTTSLTWVDTTSGVPSSVGQVFEYRARIRAQGEKTYYSNWSPVVTVSR